MANQVASGLALSIFGVGLSAFIGKPYESETLPAAADDQDSAPCRHPGLGPALFDQQSLVYGSWVLFAASSGSCTARARGSRAARRRRIADSAHSIGYPVIRIRYLATIFGGAMAGVGGAFLSVFYTPLWVEGMVAGRGWIALALVVFATWRPLRVLVGAYLFGGVMITQLFLQGSGAEIDIPSQFLTSLPYWATIIVLVVISRNLQTIRLNSPVSLGQSYRPDAKMLGSQQDAAGGWPAVSYKESSQCSSIGEAMLRSPPRAGGLRRGAAQRAGRGDAAEDRLCLREPDRRLPAGRSSTTRGGSRWRRRSAAR